MIRFIIYRQTTYTHNILFILLKIKSPTIYFKRKTPRFSERLLQRVIIPVSIKYTTQKNYIIANFGESNSEYTFLYTKETKELLVSNNFIFTDLGKLPLSASYNTTDKDEFIMIYDPAIYSAIFKQSLEKNKFTNADNEQKIRKLVEKLNEES